MMNRTLFSLICALLFLCCHQSSAAEPPLKVEKSITFITEPLDDEGLPDYFEFVRQLARQGVTPENNAVVLLWQALGPREIEQENRVAFFTELDMPVPLEEGKYLIELADERMDEAGVAWLKKINWKPPSEDDEAEPEDQTKTNQSRAGQDDQWDKFFKQREENILGLSESGWEYEADHRLQIEKLCEAAYDHPWKESEFPPLAAWLRANNQALELGVEASQRSKFYAPMIADHLEKGPPLVTRDATTVLGLRGFSQGLCIRATLHAGEGRFAEGHADLMACRRLARLAGQEQGMVASLAETYMEARANRTHIALLHEMLSRKEEVPQRLYLRMLDDLQSLPTAKGRRWVITYEERLAALDSVVEMIRKKDDPQDQSWIHNRAVIDWNYILKRFNDDFDLYEKAINEENPDRREELFEQFHDREESWREMEDSKMLFAEGLWSLEARSKQTHARLADLLWVATGAALQAERCDVAHGRLAIIATALAAFHEIHGHYPVELGELSPEFLKRIPRDPENEDMFHYSRQSQGYLLHGLGMNGQDDHGTSRDQYEDQTHYVIQGEWLTHDALQAKLDKLSETDPTGESEESEKYEGDDLVIRLPLPEFAWPKAK